MALVTAIWDGSCMKARLGTDVVLAAASVAAAEVMLALVCQLVHGKQIERVTRRW